MGPARCIVHLVISGRVQGVGYRAWVEREAAQRRLDGWVRNRADGTVEALFAGPPDFVNSMHDSCRRGPPHATVDTVTELPNASDPGTGFRVLPTERHTV